MEIEKFKKFVKEVDLWMELTEENLLSKSATLPKMIHTTMDIFAKEMRELKKLEVQKKEMYGKLLEEFKYGTKSQYRWENKSEIETQIYTDKTFIELLNRYNEQEVMVQHLEGILSNLKGMSYQIRNMIEYKKFVLGI
jgi:uncharacterized membrane protein YgaE (UPF0421/DUF939 family)